MGQWHTLLVRKFADISDNVIIGERWGRGKPKIRSVVDWWCSRMLMLMRNENRLKVVSSSTVKSFKMRLDRFWANEEIYYSQCSRIRILCFFSDFKKNCETICTFLTFFYVFFKIQKNVTFYVFFELLHTFSRTVTIAIKPIYHAQEVEVGLIMTLI